MSYSALVSLAATRSLEASRDLSLEQIHFGLPGMTLAGTILKQICPQSAIGECVPGKVRNSIDKFDNHLFWSTAHILAIATI